MAYDTLLVERDGGVTTITLNRPDSLNALNIAMSDDFVHAMQQARQDDGTRAVVLTGSGRAFCAGGDVRSSGPRRSVAEEHSYILRLARVVHEIVNLEKPVIGMVNGVAVGAGCNIALACDIVIASEEAKFSEIFVRIGLIPDLGGLFLLPRLVGLHKAKEIIFSGDMVLAREAERIGMINQAVPAADLCDVTMALAHRLANGPTKAIGLAKALLHRALATDLAGAVELEALGQSILMQTEDHKEGVRAFLDKRQPQFKGR